MIEEKTFTSDYRLESVEEAQGKFYFTATSLDNNFECEKGREILARKSIGKAYIWRHQHPLQKGNENTHIYGEVVESHINEKGFIQSKYEVYGHTQEHLDIREDIKERQRIGKPLGVSMRFRKYYIGDQILHYDVFEHSGTPFPKCVKCRNIDFIGEEDKMPNKEEKDKNEEEQKEEEEELEDIDIQESLKKINDLEEKLNSRSSILEEFKSRIVTLEKERENADKKLEEAESSEKTLEEQIDELKLEVGYLKKKPLIDSILESRKLDDKELEFYKTQNKEYLEVKLEEFKKEADSKIHVTSQEESAEKAKEKADEEFADKEPSMEKFTKHIQHKMKNDKEDKEKEKDKK